MHEVVARRQEHTLSPKSTAGGGRKHLADLRKDGLPWFGGRRLPFDAVVLPVACAVVAFGVFAYLAPQGFVWGDPPVYAEQIADLNLGIRTIHIAYFVLGIVFTRLVPIDAVHALNLMNALLGAISVGLAASIAYTITRRLEAGIAAAAVLFTLPVVVDNSVFAEVYVAQLFFFLLCVQFALWDRPVAAGLSFGCAFLVTASTALAVPFLLLLRPNRRFNIIATISAVALPALVLVPNYRDYLWGGIGLLNLQQRDTAFLGALPKEYVEVGGLAGILTLAFAAVGLVTLARSRTRRLLAVGIGLLWLATFLVAERYSDVPVQLPFYGMLAVVAGIGFARLFRVRSQTSVVAAAATVALLLAVLLPAASAFPSAQRRAGVADALRRDVGSMGAQVRSADAIVAKWPMDRIARYYLFGRPQATWIDYESLLGLMGQQQRESSWAQLDRTVAARRRIWLLDTPQASDYLSSKGYTVAEFRPFLFVATPAR